jgi:2-dehydro-3-deoxyphosphogluconate aldolase / (4S)-4-hydroxy-2-oxoglutarate aldolase
VLAPLAEVPLLVTGGVDATNARAYLDAGAVAVGVGSALGSDDELRRLLAAVA